MNGETGIMTLTEFLNAQLDEDEAEANLLLADGVPNLASMAHTPARVLREVETKRRILARHRLHSEPDVWGSGHSDWSMRGQPTGKTVWWCDECDHDRDYGHIGGYDEGCPTLRALAAVYSDHPDYDPAWAA